MTSRELQWQVSGKDVAVRVEEAKGHGTFHIADRSIPFHILDHDTLDIGGRRLRFYVICDGDSYTVWLNGRTYQLTRISKSHLAASPATSPNGEIKALMPGKLLRFEVAVGDTVSENQTVAIMESMKMESALHAPKAGRIVEIRRQPGQVVEMGEVLMVID